MISQKTSVWNVVSNVCNYCVGIGCGDQDRD